MAAWVSHRHRVASIVSPTTIKDGVTTDWEPFEGPHVTTHFGRRDIYDGLPKVPTTETPLAGPLPAILTSRWQKNRPKRPRLSRLLKPAKRRESNCFWCFQLLFCLLFTVFHHLNNTFKRLFFMFRIFPHTVCAG
jgi:hypothetical protein